MPIPGSAAAATIEETIDMRRILIPVDGTTPEETILRAVTGRRREGLDETVHLLNVQAPLTAYVTRFVSRASVADFQRELGEKAMAGIRRRFDRAEIHYAAHFCVGDVAATIGEAAQALRASEILMALEQDGWWDSLATWLQVNRIRRYATVPVVVVVAPPPEIVPAFGGFGTSTTR
jgi:hypothetical protein